MKDEWWKLQHLQTIQTCHCQRMSGKYGKVTSWHAAAFSDSAETIPHTRPWRPRHQSCCMPNRCPWRTSLSSAPRPRPGNRDRSRLASSSRALPFKSWSLKSGEHMTFNPDIWISLIQNLANNAESDSCLQHLHIWQLSLNRDEWWNYRTSKPSKLVTVKGCRKHMKTEAFSGGLYRQNLIIEILRTNICKYEKKTFNSDMWISLMRNLANNGNQPRNPNFHSPSTCSKKSPRSTMNDETPAPPNHPNLSLSQDAGKVWESDIMNMPQHSAIQRSPSHTPGLGALVANLVESHIDVLDGRVCLQRLGQGLETETDQGWRLHPGLYRSNRDHWNPENTWHFNSDIWISLIQNLANNAESDSCLQHLHIWQLSLNRDEWWNYRTSKPSKLVTVKGCRKHMKTEALSGGLYRQSLITEILRTNICKYEKNI